MQFICKWNSVIYGYLVTKEANSVFSSEKHLFFERILENLELDIFALFTMILNGISHFAITSTQTLRKFSAYYLTLLKPDRRKTF